MRRNFLGVISILLFFSGISHSDGVYSRAGSAGVTFLKLGLGARAAGLGDAFTAVCEGASAVYWNPAGLTQSEGAHLLVAHTEHFQDVRFEDLAWSRTSGARALGLAVRGLYTDGIELRTSATVDPIGTFQYHDFMLSASVAQRLGQQAGVGVTYRRIFERIYTYDTDGWALDLGFLYETPIRDLTFGTALQNVGPRMHFTTESFNLPLTGRAGFAYRVPWSVLGGKPLLCADLVKSRDNPIRLDMGSEFAYRSLLLLRAGYKFGHDTESFSAGLGFLFSRYGIDYAFVPNELGTVHRFSLGVKL